MKKYRRDISSLDFTHSFVYSFENFLIKFDCDLDPVIVFLGLVTVLLLMISNLGIF